MSKKDYNESQYCPKCKTYTYFSIHQNKKKQWYSKCKKCHHIIYADIIKTKKERAKHFLR